MMARVNSSKESFRSLFSSISLKHSSTACSIRIRWREGGERERGEEMSRRFKRISKRGRGDGGRMWAGEEGDYQI